MAETFNKKEREKKKRQRKKEKEARKESRKDQSGGGSLENMMAYVDENGIIRDTPPDPSEKTEIDAKNIEIGVPKKEDVDPVINGKVSHYDDAKGYGFIKADDGEIYFVHHSNISGTPAPGKKARFEKEKGPKGWVAVKVKID